MDYYKPKLYITEYDQGFNVFFYNILIDFLEDATDNPLNG